EDLSMGLFAATVCDDGPFPWDPATPLSQRPGLLAAARSALPPGSTGPFGIWATDIGPAPFCLLWPPQARRPGIGSGPLPNVPVLVLTGERDLRTPSSNAAAIAARFPQGRLVSVPGVATASSVPTSRVARRTPWGFGSRAECRRRAVRARRCSSIQSAPSRRPSRR